MAIALILPCPIRDEGILMAQAQDGLPGQLDDQFGFLSALNTGVIRDGQSAIHGRHGHDCRIRHS